ncbi:hypothetical protein Val02_31350 [Virgisporangium aliadipatigenens]|uniref:Uncharacterized protein n=1 Tax=Virgisporangium aliadipatigenens TaxID=741659 RepID=A0A8J3YJ35_9ACTN|nr:hypothetical protein Val02_31350 [Virgisporangium aliadipatigenens]
MRPCASGPADSPIKNAADLAGKKVAANTLENINTTSVNRVVTRAGGDPRPSGTPSCRLRPADRRAGGRARRPARRAHVYELVQAAKKGHRPGDPHPRGPHALAAK